MSAKKAQKSNPTDILKWIVGLLIVAAAVGGNVYLESQLSAPVRAAGVIVLVIIALLILKTTRSGGVAWKFFKDSRMEMRKVVWPTRQETVQSTMMVIAVVAITALILWGVDTLFAVLISHIII